MGAQTTLHTGALALNNIKNNYSNNWKILYEDGQDGAFGVLDKIIIFGYISFIWNECWW